jgi:aminopeptidase N
LPTAEITRSETRARAELVTVIGYQIDLDVTVGQERFDSVSTIRFDCAEAGAEIHFDLDAEGGQIRELVLNGVSLDPAAHYREGRIALPGLAAQNTVRVAAGLPYRSDGSGLHRSVDPADGKVYIYTMFALDHARQVFACFEQPDLKAPFTISVTAPEHWAVVSTSVTPEPQPLGDGRATWAFEPTPPLPTYLAHVTAGEYVFVHDTHTTPRGQVIPLGIGCRASLAEYLDAPEVFEITAGGLDYYTGQFNLDYPFPKYDHVFVPGFLAGAMENPGAVTMSDGMIFRSRQTEHRHEQRARTILHEMAHQWFGDYVTMRWWDDLWLNESFAEFCGTDVAARTTKYTQTWTTFANVRKGWGYDQDQQPSTHPIAAAGVESVAEATANFDGISYAKGASVLKQLIASLGHDAFTAGIRAYFTEHAWGNATLADFLSALSDAGGKDLTGWSRLWLETTGPNTLRAEFETDADDRFTAFTVVQTAAQEHPTLRPHHIAIGLYARRDGALVRVGRVEADVDGPRTEVRALVGQQRPDLLLLNDDDLAYTLIEFDDRSQATLTEAVGEFEDSLARSVCMTSAANMMMRGRMSLPAFLRLTAAAMAEEKSVSVVANLHQTVHLGLALLADPARVREGKDFLAGEAARLLRAAEQGSDHQLAWVRLLTVTAVADEHLDLLDGLLEGTAEVPGVAVDTDLRWALLLRLAATGRADDARIDAELERDRTDTGVRMADVCRAAIPDAEHKAAAWELLTGDAEPDPQTIVETSIAFRMPENADLAQIVARYTPKFFEILPDLWTRRSGFARQVLGLLLFPTVDAGPELLARADAFLAEHKDGDAGMLRAVVEGRDTAECAIASRALA